MTTPTSWQQRDGLELCRWSGCLTPITARRHQCERERHCTGPIEATERRWHSAFTKIWGEGFDALIKKVQEAEYINF
jgi:hypothetical protein